MTNYRRVATRKARKYGLNPRIFKRQINQESGFNPHAVSPAGARGIAQIMPATARGWRVNPDNPRQALDAAARNMASYVRRYGSYENALRAYNAGPGNIERSKGFSETNNYVNTILGGSNPKRLGRRSFAPAANRGTGTSRSITLPGWVREQQTFDQGGYQKAVRRSRVASYLQQQGKGNSILFRSGLLSTEAPDPTDFTGAKLVAGPSSTIRAPGGRGKRGGLQTPRVARSGKGRVDIASTANRAGVPIRPIVVNFVEKIADIMGAHLTIGTGTNHSRLTVNGNVSDHYDGHGADVPLRGPLLVKAGQDALIAAGMNPRKARKKTGGLFNVGGWQIIFNTHIGGDHTNHLHVGKSH